MSSPSGEGPRVAAIRNVLVAMLLASGFIYVAANQIATTTPTQPIKAPAASTPPVAFSVNAPPPSLARCPSCPVTIPVTEQTRRAVRDGSVYFFLNETCESQWLARNVARPE